MKRIVMVGALAAIIDASPAAAHVPESCGRLAAAHQESLDVLGVHIQLFGNAR